MLKRMIASISALAIASAFGAVSVTAGEWGFYGSARVPFFMTSTSEEVGATGDAESDMALSLQGNSRIGASVKNGDVSGGFEYGSGPNLRKLYANVKLGGGSLTIGQTYTPIDSFLSGQVYGGDAGLLNYGGLYSGRLPQIKYVTGGLQIAALPASTSAPVGITAVDYVTTLPKIEASYALKAGPIALGLQFGYNSYIASTGDVAAVAAKEEVKVEGVIIQEASPAVEAADATDYTISSMILGLSAKMNFGAAYVNFGLHSGTNTGNYGLWQTGYSIATYNPVDDEIVDTSTMGIVLAGGAALSETARVEVGYGTITHSNDDFDADDDANAMYVQANITIAKGFYVVPEVGVLNHGTSSADADEGSTTYAGAKFQANF